MKAIAHLLEDEELQEMILAAAILSVLDGAVTDDLESLVTEYLRRERHAADPVDKSGALGLVREKHFASGA